MNKLKYFFAYLLIFTFAINMLHPTHIDAASFTVKVDKNTIKVGSQLKIKSSDKDATYYIKDKEIATVSQEGIVTGKKAGKCEIVVTNSGGKVQKLSLTVETKKYMPPTVGVTMDDLKIQNQKFEKASSDNYKYFFELKNRSKTGTLKKVILHYSYKTKKTITVQIPIEPDEPDTKDTEISEPDTEIDDSEPDTEIDDSEDTEISEPDTQTNDSKNTDVGNTNKNSAYIMKNTSTPNTTQYRTEKKVTYTSHTKSVTIKNLKPGEVSKQQSFIGDYTAKTKNMHLDKVEIYSNQALLTYNLKNNTYKFQWGSKDTKAPIFSGYLEKNSTDGLGDIYRVYYSDMKNKYNFKEFVSVKDDRDKDVKISVNTKKINWKKSGTYKIYYTAKDSSGNIAKTWAKCQIIVAGNPEKVADQIIKQVTKSSWSKEKKAKELYKFIRSNICYVGYAKHIDWRSCAVKAINNQSGDCYSFYSVSKLLLTRIGVPNIMIKRYPTPGNWRHFWNLAYVDGGWYHYDATPRSRNATFCLLTDQQMWHYTNNGTFKFKDSLYPSRATKEISTTPKPISQCVRGGR